MDTRLKAKLFFMFLILYVSGIVCTSIHKNKFTVSFGIISSVAFAVYTLTAALQTVRTSKKHQTEYHRRAAAERLRALSVSQNSPILVSAQIQEKPYRLSFDAVKNRTINETEKHKTLFRKFTMIAED